MTNYLKFIIFIFLLGVALGHLRMYAIDLAQLNILIFIIICVISFFYVIFQNIIIFFIPVIFLLFYLLIGIINLSDPYYIIYDSTRIFGCICIYLASFYFFKNQSHHTLLGVFSFTKKWTIYFFIILFFSFALPYFLGKNMNLSIQLDPLPFIILAIFGNGSMLLAIVFSLLTYKRMFFVGTITVATAFYLRLNKAIFKNIFILIFLILALIIFVPQLPKYVETLSTIKLMMDNDNTYFEILNELSTTRFQELIAILKLAEIQHYFFGFGLGGGVVERFGTEGNVIKSPFIHISIVSLFLKIGLTGVIVLFFSIFYQYLHIKKRGGYTYEFLIILLYGFTCSLFASYFLVSPLFWLALGGIAAIKRDK